MLYDFDELGDDAPTNPDVRALRPRVLVVEDDAPLREMIVARMRSEAYEVIEAGTGHEALEVLGLVARGATRDDIDLVVLDVHIPGTSGLEIARLMRTSAWRTPVVLITAFPDPAVVDEAAELHLALLAKPFPLDRLSAAAIAAIVAPRGL